MKRIVLSICVLSLCATLFAQRYDYDDIYFNPKKDIQKITDDRVQITDDRVESEDNSQLSTLNFLILLVSICFIVMMVIRHKIV